MSQEAPLSKQGRVNAQIRTVVVIVLAAIAVAVTLPDIILPWQPWASYGMGYEFVTPAQGRVYHVDPGGPADRAGIRVGDIVELDRMSYEDRRSSTEPYNAAAAGTVTRFVIGRGASVRTVTLVAVTHERSLGDNISDVVQTLAQSAFPILAMFLLLARPCALTWAFFVYALSTTGYAITTGIYSPSWVQTLQITWFDVASAVGVAAFIVFALRFPSNVTAGWRRIVERVILALTIPVAAAALYASPLGLGFFAPGAVAVASVANWLFIAGYIVGAFAFIHTVFTATQQERPRVMWVVFGFLVGDGSYALLNFLAPHLAAFPIWVNNLIQTLNVIVPITVMYAILKHRVIDVRFFLNRALVYGILTTIGVGLLVLLDWAVAKRLEAFGLIVEVAGALVLGVGIQRLHGFVDALVDRYVFRSMHEAEKHLERVADAMMYAESLDAIDKLLVEESARALQLRSCAVFRREGEAFRREASVGWTEDETKAIAVDDPLALDLQAQKAGVAASPFLANRIEMPQGAAAPAFAVPIRIREQMIGFALFGAHLNASDIDPNEQHLLQTLVSRATIAYDHVSSLERAAENARMRIELDFLRGLVQPHA